MAITAMKAQELEQMGESTTQSIEVETTDEIITESIEVQTSNEEIQSTQPLESSTEELSVASSEETTERITLLLQEVDPNDKSFNEPSFVETINLETTTESVEPITSEYNGFDVNQSESEFSCFGRSFGQYADVTKECRVFHLCYPFINSTTDELLYQRITFLCDNDSVFDQKKFICVDNSTVGHKCTDSEALYKTTNQEYLIRVFSQSVSPIDEVKGQSEAEVKPSSSPSWFNWFYRN